VEERREMGDGRRGIETEEGRWEGESWRRDGERGDDDEERRSEMRDVEERRERGDEE
jgi:hypothetical protein